MIQVTPQMRILVAVERADFRKGIDSLAARQHNILRPLSSHALTWVVQYLARSVMRHLQPHHRTAGEPLKMGFVGGLHC